MAFALTPNTTPLTDGEAIWKLKELLVAAGWVVRASGTGSGAVYSAAGDAHAPGGPYAGTLDLLNSWIVIQQPVAATPRREILLIRTNVNHGVWRIYYSSNGVGFTGGAPSATVAPTALDAPGGASLIGAVCNAPSGSTNFFSSSIGGFRTYRTDYLIGDATEGFSFLMQNRKIGYNAAYSMFGLDVLQNANAADMDPAVIFITFATSDTDRGIANEANGIYSNSEAQTQGCCRGWHVKGGGAEAWVNFPFTGFGFQNGTTNRWEPVGENFPPSEDSVGRYPSFPMIYSRGGTAMPTSKGHKGRSRIFKYEMQKLGVRPYAGKTRWIMGSWSIPWDGLTDMAV